MNHFERRMRHMGRGNEKRVNPKKDPCGSPLPDKNFAPVFSAGALHDAWRVCLTAREEFRQVVECGGKCNATPLFLGLMRIEKSGAIPLPSLRFVLIDRHVW
jgi:hypothetical protein